MNLHVRGVKPRGPRGPRGIFENFGRIFWSVSEQILGEGSPDTSRTSRSSRIFSGRLTEIDRSRAARLHEALAHHELLVHGGHWVLTAGGDCQVGSGVRHLLERHAVVHGVGRDVGRGHGVGDGGLHGARVYSGLLREGREWLNTERVQTCV